MWCDRWGRISLIQLAAASLIFGGAAAIADDISSTTSTVETKRADSNTALPTGADSATSNGGAATSNSASASPVESTTTSTSTSASTSPSSTTSASTTTSTSTPSASTSETAPGPLFEKRKSLLSRIMAAKKQGTGISGYLAEYGRIEGMVKAGEPQSAYEERLDSLSTNIDEQLKRSQILKTQHPTGPYAGSGATSTVSASSSSSSNHSGGSSSGGGGSGGLSPNVIEQLKQKYGDKIPAGMSEKLGNITPEQRDKLLQSDMLKKFLSK